MTGQGRWPCAIISPRRLLPLPGTNELLRGDAPAPPFFRPGQETPFLTVQGDVIFTFPGNTRHRSAPTQSTSPMYQHAPPEGDPDNMPRPTGFDIDRIIKQFEDARPKELDDESGILDEKAVEDLLSLDPEWAQRPAAPRKPTQAPPAAVVAEPTIPPAAAPTVTPTPAPTVAAAKPSADPDIELPLLEAELDQKSDSDKDEEEEEEEGDFLASPTDKPAEDKPAGSKAAAKPGSAKDDGFVDVLDEGPGDELEEGPGEVRPSEALLTGDGGA